MNRLTDNLIKILSLGIGLAIGIVLIAKVCFELSYDGFYKDVDRIYCIMENFIMQQGEDPTDFEGTSGAIAPGFKAEIPGVEAHGSRSGGSGCEKELRKEGKGQ